MFPLQPQSIVRLLQEPSMHPTKYSKDNPWTLLESSHCSLESLQVLQACAQATSVLSADSSCRIFHSNVRNWPQGNCLQACKLASSIFQF